MVVKNGHPGLTSSQAWSILTRHARDDIEPLRLQELCADNDRVSSLVAVYNTTTGEGDNRILIADLSRQRMTLDTLNHLLQLATARNLRTFMTRLAWGQNHPRQPVRPARVAKKRQPSPQKTARFHETPLDPETSSPMSSMHLALRVPAGRGYEMFNADGDNVLDEVHRSWDRLERLSDCLRRGQLRGVSGSMIRDVVVIGRGVPLAALQFVDTALRRDERSALAARLGLVENASVRLRRGLVGASNLATRRLHFLTTVDPIAAARLVGDLEAASTLVVSIALNGNEETGLATRTLKSWLLTQLGTNRRADHVLAKHMLLVTGNDRIVSVINKPESVFLVPEHSRCEPFTTFTAAALLPLSIVYGWPIAKEFLDGAHDMDTHFVETNPRHNLPVLLALTDVWNDAFLGTSARVVTPWTEAFAAFPAFVGALEAQTCGRPSGHMTPSKLKCSSAIVDGGLDCAFDRSSYQASHVMNSELVMAMDPQIQFNAGRALGPSGIEDVFSAQDTLMCSLFAHADELAFGYNRNTGDAVLPPSSPMAAGATDSDLSEGNRPSVLLMPGKLDSFACGQLVALSEHRAVVKAHLWGLDPFVRETGSSLRMYRTDQLKEDLHELLQRSVDEEDEGETSDRRMTLSTKTILGHYATIVRDQRFYTVNGT